MAIGKYIAAKAGYRRIVLELGGNDPIIVMDDADLDEASTLAVQGSYKNSGQRCTAVKRMLVHEAVAARFTELRGREDARLDATATRCDPAIDMGTVIDEAAARLFEARVNEAVAQGARAARRQPARRRALLADRARPRAPRDDAWCARRPSARSRRSSPSRHRRGDRASPTAPPTACRRRCARNRLDYITRFVAELHVGSVNVREVPGYRLELTPFGGIKDSGLGYKEGVQEAMKSFTNLKTYSLPVGLRSRTRLMLHLLNLLAAIALLVWGTHIVRTGMLRVFGENLRRVLARELRQPLSRAASPGSA